MNNCIPVEEMGTLRQLPEDDERRRHAATCPRCSSLMFAYDQFVHAGLVDCADPDAAEAQIERFLATHGAGSNAGAEAVSATRRNPRRRWFDLAGFRFAAAAAAVVVIAIALMRWQPWSDDEIIYRGEPREQFTTLRAAPTSDGTVELRWDAVIGADSYRVIILAGDLAELTRLEPTAQLSVQFDPRSVGNGPRYWQVSALAEGAEMLTSDPQSLP